MAIVSVSAHFEFTIQDEGSLDELFERARYNMERYAQGVIVGEIEAAPCTTGWRVLIPHQMDNGYCRLLHAQADTDLWCSVCDMALDRLAHPKIHEARTATA